MAAINYNAILAGDTILQQALQAIAQARTAGMTQLDAARQAALVRLGIVPKNLGFDVPQSVADLAAAATRSGFSTLGQLSRQYADANAATNANLGERGLARSGDVGFLANRNLQAHQLAEAGALDQTQQGLAQSQADYLSNNNTLNQQRADVTQQGWQRIIDQINAGLLGAGPSTTPTGSVPNTYVQGSAGRGSEYAGQPAQTPYVQGTAGRGSVYSHAAPHPPSIPRIPAGAIAGARAASSAPRML